jgi:hypothetical protein
MGAVHNLQQNLLGMKLRPIPVRNLAILEHALSDIFSFNNGAFELTIPAETPIHKNLISKLAKNGVKQLYIFEEDLVQLNHLIKEKMIKITRSLSIGDFEKNTKTQITLMSLHLNNLYQNPFNDENLDVQYKCTSNLAKLLIENKNLGSYLYAQLKKQNHHFIISQPILSSLLLLGYLKHLAVFQNSEMENLFITSMMKDLGISFVPQDKLNKSNLSTEEKKLFSLHPESSKSILSGRVPLSRNYLSIIENHHHFNPQITQIISNIYTQEHVPSNLVGFETLVVAMMDILVAMTEGRPYRAKCSLFESLDLIKKLMIKEYPHEFKTLVIYLRQFFSNF